MAKVVFLQTSIIKAFISCYIRKRVWFERNSGFRNQGSVVWVLGSGSLMYNGFGSRLGTIWTICYSGSGGSKKGFKRGFIRLS